MNSDMSAEARLAKEDELRWVGPTRSRSHSLSVLGTTLTGPWVRRWFLSLFVILLFPSAGSSASPDPVPAVTASPTPTPVPLQEVVVTADRSENLLSGIPRSVSLVDRRTLETWSQKPLGDILEGFAGSNHSVNGNGFASSKSSLSLRGWGMGGEILIARDGRRLSNDTDGEGFDLSLIDPSTLERVEILRGSSSALYGSGAHAGVANLVTRRPDEGSRTSFEGMGGSNGHLSSSLSTEGRAKDWEYRFTAGFSQRGDHDTPDHGVLANSGFHRSFGSLFLGRPISSSEDVSFLAQFGHGWDDGFPGDLFAPAASDRNLWDDRGYAKVEYRRSWNGGSLRLLYDQGLKDRGTHRERTQGVTFITIDQRQSSRSYGGASILEETFGPHRAIVGAEGFYEDHWGHGSVLQEAPGTDSTFNAPKLPPAGVLNGAFFLQDEWKALERLSVTFGGRFDAYRLEHAGGPLFEGDLQDHQALTGHLGVLLSLGDALGVKASFGNSFVMPNVVQLYTFDPRTGFALLGNPVLGPATGHSLDLGIVWGGPDLRVELTAFTSDLWGRQVLGILLRDFGGGGTQFLDLNGEFGRPDLLDDPALVNAPTDKWFYHYNLGRMRNQGLEGSVEAVLGDGWGASGSFSWNTLMRELSTGDWITGIPPFTGRIETTWRGHGVEAAILGRVGAGYSVQSRTRPGLPVVFKEGHFTTDLSVSVGLNDSTELVGAILNLFDTAWQRTLDVPEPGRTYQAGIRWTL